jgi:raffinose/stachyose/melibiose transport system permease protein
MATITGTDIPAVDESAAHTIPARRDEKHLDKTYYLMLVPAVAAFSFFITLPTLVGIFYSFTNYVGYGHFHFIGLTNYRAAVSDPNIRHAYGFTLGFAITTTWRASRFPERVPYKVPSWKWRLRWPKGERSLLPRLRKRR